MNEHDPGEQKIPAPIILGVAAALIVLCAWLVSRTQTADGCRSSINGTTLANCRRG